MGEAHRYHRFHDFQNAEQFSHPIAPTKPTSNREMSSITVKTAVPTLKANPISKSNGRSNSSNIGKLEATGSTSPYVNDGSHPEISPYELGPSHVAVNQSTVGGNQIHPGECIMDSLYV